MVDPFGWAERRSLSANVVAAHSVIVAYLEEASEPWSDDQTKAFERTAVRDQPCCCRNSRIAGRLQGWPFFAYRLGKRNWPGGPSTGGTQWT